MILGLDPSTNFAWAVGNPGGLPQFGVEHFPMKGDEYGQPFDALERWLNEVIIEHNVTIVHYESPLGVTPSFNFKIKRYQYGQLGLIEMVCFRRLIPCSETAKGPWYDYFVGRRPTKLESKRKGFSLSKWQKAATIKECCARGWWTDDDNIADALGVWDHRCFLYSASYRHRRGPDIRRREDEISKQPRFV